MTSGVVAFEKRKNDTEELVEKILLLRTLPTAVPYPVYSTDARLETTVVRLPVRPLQFYSTVVCDLQKMTGVNILRMDSTRESIVVV